MTSGQSAPAAVHDFRRKVSMVMNRGIPALGLLLLAVSCQSPGKGGPAPEGALYPEEILTSTEVRQEIAEKERRVLDWLRREKLAAVLLNTPANFNWITGGGSRRLDPIAPRSAPLLIRDDGRKFLFDSGGQPGRILAGEMESLGYEVRRTGWSCDPPNAEPAAETLKDLTGGRGYASDDARAGARLACTEIAALRAPLTEWEVRKYRWLGGSCSRAVDMICRRMERWWTDRGIETMLYEVLVRRAIRPLTVHVEADTEVPGTATRKVADRALISVSASRWGLVVAMTRTVHFGSVPAELEQRQKAAARVAAGLWARTVPGATGGAILEGVIADYAASGYPDDWRSARPGGMIGYAPCEWEATPGGQARVREFEAFAWNAAVGDFRMQDTILLDGDRLVILTETPGWPVIEARALGRIYRLPAILRIDR
jgi:Xaa-Pro dipeptidase